MQNLTIEKKPAEINNSPKNYRLTILDIEKFYLSNVKNSNLFGIEYERISFDKKTKSVASYDKISKVIRNFSEILKWELIYDSDIVIGAKDNEGNSISLEPGCQLELSLKPFENLVDIQSKAGMILNLLDHKLMHILLCYLHYLLNDRCKRYNFSLFLEIQIRIMPHNLIVFLHHQLL